MKLDEYFLLAAFSYLRADSALSKNLQSTLSSSPYEFIKPRLPGEFSVGSTEPSGRAIGFFEWADSLRREGILSMRVSRIGTTLPENLEFTAATLFGSSQEILRVSTKITNHDYLLSPSASPRFKATAENFVSIVDQQADPAELWAYISARIKEFLTLNGDLFNPSKTGKQLMLELPNNSLWDPLGDSLFRELQVFALCENFEIVIPKNLSSLVSAFTFDDEFDDPQLKDYVYFYKEKDVTIEMFIEMIEAQTESPEVRRRLSQLLIENEKSISFDLNSPEWKIFLKKASPEQFETLVGWACRAVSNVCSEFKSMPIIPIGQESFWGPSPLDLKRIRARESLQKKGLQLTPFEEPWQFYEFHPMDQPAKFSEAHGFQDDGEGVIEDYRHSLGQIIPFSKEINSPFTEAFRLADFILQHPKTILSGGNSATLFLNRNGFSDLAVEIFLEKTELIQNLSSMRFEETEIIQFLSLEVSDVFGGMGSWNDQYFQDISLQEKFNSISSALISSRNLVFQSLLNYNSGS